MVISPGSYLRCLQILQHEVPELGRRVQQQELEASRSDAGRLSRFSARNGGADGNGKQRGCLFLIPTQTSFFSIPLSTGHPLYLRHNEQGAAVFCPPHLFISPAWLRSWARSWLTAALGEPTMKCKTT